jgi:hypothetical protein
MSKLLVSCHTSCPSRILISCLADKMGQHDDSLDTRVRQFLVPSVPTTVSLPRQLHNCGVSALPRKKQRALQGRIRPQTLLRTLRCRHQTLSFIFDLGGVQDMLSYVDFVAPRGCRILRPRIAPCRHGLTNIATRMREKQFHSARFERSKKRKLLIAQ